MAELHSWRLSTDAGCRYFMSARPMPSNHEVESAVAVCVDRLSLKTTGAYSVSALQTLRLRIAEAH